MEEQYQGTSEHWLDRPEAGGWFAIWLIRFIGLHFGRTFARLILYPSAAPRANISDALPASRAARGR